MDGLFSEIFGFDPLSVEPTEQNLIDYHPEEDEATLDEWYSLPR